MKKNIVLSANIPWVISNFRTELIQQLILNGYTVHCVSCSDKYFGNDLDYVRVLLNLGCKYHEVYIEFMGTRPFAELKTFFGYLKLYKKIRPDLLLNFTIKPNIYSTLAGKLLGIPSINNITGLGTLYTNPGVLSKIATILYKLSQKSATRVFFQNSDDMEFFTRKKKIIKPWKAVKLPGSGVNTSKFLPPTQKQNQRSFIFLVAARMLWDKGIGEYVEAARRLKRKYSGIECQLLGFVESENVSAISKQQIDAWNNEGVINYLGQTDAILDYYQNADCQVLPSYYREGIPRSLLEAASTGLPIITTDMPGCREVVEHGVNGFLIKPRDPSDLFEKMETVFLMEPARRIKMGLFGRRKMIEKFDVQIVINKYMDVIKSINTSSS